MATKAQRKRAEKEITKGFEAIRTLSDSLRHTGRLLGNPEFEHGPKTAHEASCYGDLHGITNFLLKCQGLALGDIYHDEED